MAVRYKSIIRKAQNALCGERDFSCIMPGMGLFNRGCKYGGLGQGVSNKPSGYTEDIFLF